MEHVDVEEVGFDLVIYSWRMTQQRWEREFRIQPNSCGALSTDANQETWSADIFKCYNHWSW